MNHREIEGLLPAYALDALEPEERAQVEAHLTTCPWCAALAQQHAEVAAWLGSRVEGEQAPPGVRQRLLERVRHTGSPGAAAPQGRWARMAPTLLPITATLALLLLGGLIAASLWFSNAVNTLRSQDDELMELVRSQRAMTYMLADPSTKVVMLQGQPEGHSQGMLLFTPERSTAWLIAGGLPPLPESHTYRVWVIHNGEWTSVGYLQVDATGWGQLTLGAPFPMEEYETLGITMEPAEGSVTPSAEPVLLGTLK